MKAEGEKNEKEILAVSFGTVESTSAVFGRQQPQYRQHSEETLVSRVVLLKRNKKKRIIIKTRLSYFSVKSE